MSVLSIKTQSLYMLEYTFIYFGKKTQTPEHLNFITLHTNNVLWSGFYGNKGIPLIIYIYLLYS